MNFKNLNIILCITGGIAAYKAVSLASLLKKKGANVFPVLTKNATKFITPLTLKTITKNKVTIDMFDESDFIPHISLSDLADIIIVAPATANIIAKAANGIADDMVSTLLLSCSAKKFIIPAMNTKMYLNKITQENINRLKSNNYFIMDPDDGDMACGTSGPGRYPDNKKILDFISAHDKKTLFFKNKKILITLGGTVEDIDPVRFITNRSSGKMGFNLAEQFINYGGDVTLITANVNDNILQNFINNYPEIKIIKIRSALEMKEEIIKFKNNFDIYVMAAAVADYKPVYSENKIKKSDNDLLLKLTKTDDILKSLEKRKNALYIGFAAESNDLIDNAKKKLKEKNIDLIIANNISGNKSAIGSDMAEVYLLNKWNDEIIKIEYNSKKLISKNIIDNLILLIKQNKVF